MIENTVLAILTAVITFIGTNYLKEHSKYEDYINEYYIRVLEVFYGRYKNEQALNIQVFYKGIVNNNYHIIPTYVHLLAQEERWEDIKKIFVIDYIDKRPKLRTVTSNNMQKIVDILGYIFFIGYLAIGSIMSINILRDMMKYFLKFNMTQIIVGLGSFFIVFMVYLISLKYMIYITMQEEYYIYNRKKMQKIIQHKLKSYDIRIRRSDFI